MKHNLVNQFWDFRFSMVNLLHAFSLVSVPILCFLHFLSTNSYLWFVLSGFWKNVDVSFPNDSFSCLAIYHDYMFNFIFHNMFNFFLLPLLFILVFVNCHKLYNAVLSIYHNSGVYSRSFKIFARNWFGNAINFINVVFQILTWSISGTGASLQIMCNVFWHSLESQDMSLTCPLTQPSLWKRWASWLCSPKPCSGSRSSTVTIRIGRLKEWGKSLHL